MEKVTFFESIVKILNTIASVPFLIEILLLTLVLLIVMLFFYFKKSKKGRVTTLIIYIATLVLLPISHISFFVNSIDKIIENFVKVIFFPSWYMYFIMLIVTDVSIFKELKKAIKEEKTKWINVFNFSYFFIFQFLFVLIIYLVTTENINMFESRELYNNTILLSAIQVSSYMFWIRIFIIVLIVIINKLSNFDFKKHPKSVEEEPLSDNTMENNAYNYKEYDEPESNYSNNNYSNNTFNSIYDNSTQLNQVINPVDNLNINTDKLVNQDNSYSINTNTIPDDNVGGNTSNKLTLFSDLPLIDNNNKTELYEKEEKKDNIEILNFDEDNRNKNYFDDFYE